MNETDLETKEDLDPGPWTRSNQPQALNSTGTGTGFASNATNRTYLLTPPTQSDWPQLDLSLQFWLIFVCTIVSCWIVISFVLAYFFGPDFVTCYLCDQQIPRRYWQSGEHRMECAKKHEEFLETLPAPVKTARCPICYRILRLFPPTSTVTTFVCLSNKPCQELSGQGEQMSKKPVTNTGENRFNCYNCDYDICDRCLLGEPVQNGWVVGAQDVGIGIGDHMDIELTGMPPTGPDNIGQLVPEEDQPVQMHVTSRH